MLGWFSLLALAVLVLSAASAPEEKQEPTFYKDVVPILQDHCQSCHRPGEVAPMPLVTYEQTRPWAPRLPSPKRFKTR